MIDLIPMAVFYYHELHTLYHFSTSQKKIDEKRAKKIEAPLESFPSEKAQKVE